MKTVSFTKDASDMVGTEGQPLEKEGLASDHTVSHHWTGFLGASCVAGILFISIFEVFSRYVLNAPTYWATEISTYICVAVVFLSLIYSQLRGDHIRVEAIIELVPLKKRQLILQSGDWLGVFFLAVCTAQMGVYVVAEWQAGTRSWGLLSTPLWIPEVPAVIGLAAFLLYFTYELASKSTQPIYTALVLVLIGSSVVIAYGLKGSKVEIIGQWVPWSVIVIALLTSFAAAITANVRVGLIVISSIAFFSILLSICSGFGEGIAAIAIVIALGVLLASGMQVALAIGLVGAFGLMFLTPVPQLVVVAERTWNGVNSFTFTAVPMFVLMGSLLMRSGISGSLFNGLVVWMGRFPGGLAQATLAASGLFAALSGSSIATAATIGRAAGSEMIDRGYSPKIALGSIAGGGTLGILVPPSIPMIIFGSMVGASVTKLFVAAVIPGLLVLLSMMVVVFFWTISCKETSIVGEKYSWTEKAKALVEFGPFLALIVIVITSLYLGIVTPTEAGALGATLAVILAAFLGKLSVRMLAEAFLETAALSASILFIVVGAGLLSWLVDYLNIATKLVELTNESALPIFVVLLMLMLIYIVLGMFIDPISMMLMTVTIAFPIVQHAGYDALWFGVALMMMIEVGLITPPMGIILYVLRGLYPKVPFKEISSGSTVFVLVILANAVLIAVFPEIVTWLPSLIK